MRMKSRHDLSGKVFGELTVLRLFLKDEKNTNHQWLCKCSCGKETVKTNDYLHTSPNPSCGCQAQISYVKRRKQINPGEKFGRLTVLCVDHSARNGVHYKCLCDCGKETIVYGGDLRANKTKSCGCLLSETSSRRNAKDLRGNKFGCLTPIEVVKKDKHGKRIWKCLCDCGAITYVATENLCNGHIKSCGCIVSYGEKTVSQLLAK